MQEVPWWCQNYWCFRQLSSYRRERGRCWNPLTSGGGAAPGGRGQRTLAEGHHVGTQSRQEMMSLYGCLEICSQKFLDVTLKVNFQALINFIRLNTLI